MRERRLGVVAAGQYEETVGIAVEDRKSRLLEPLLGPEQQLASRAGDRIRERRIVEPARGRPEHAVERVHQNLDCVRGDVVVRLLRRFAAREQLIEQARQNRRFAAERAARRSDHIVFRRRRFAVRQRIDVERANDARIQAPEIEHPHVGVEPRDRLEHVTALLRGVNARVISSHGRRDDAFALELAQIEEVE